MQKINAEQAIPRRSYRPERRLCPRCRSFLKRSHILWRKRLITLEGPVSITSWGYRCPNPDCAEADVIFRSAEAEGLHLRKRQFGRDVLVQVGYRRFWYHQTIYEIHDWLTQDLGLAVSDRQVPNLIADFLALLRAAQPAKVRQQLQGLPHLIIGVDGMQPEKGNACLYIVRELQLDLTLLAEHLDDSSDATIRTRLFQPLQALAAELHLPWYGVVSDAQDSICTAVHQELPGVPHQACQSHCLREAGDLTFQADQTMKKQLKMAFRQRLRRVEQRIAQLPASDPCQAVLADYAAAMHATLLEGGVAPFELGGVRVFEDLTAVTASLTRCQQKGGISCCGGCSRSPTAGSPLPRKWRKRAASGSGSSTWSISWTRPRCQGNRPPPEPKSPPPWIITWSICSPRSPQRRTKQTSAWRPISTRRFATAGGACSPAMTSPTCPARTMTWKGTCGGSKPASAGSPGTSTPTRPSSATGATSPVWITRKA
jgi:hypothetical protein